MRHKEAVMKKIRYAICTICGAACGLIADVENNKVVSLRGDKDDSHSRGNICPKGLSLPDQIADPDRIVEPIRKKAYGAWESVKWETAFDDIAGRLSDIIKKHGRDSIAIYAGDATTHNYAELFATALFVLSIDTKNFFTPNSLDSLPRQLASALLYDNSGMLPVPDVSRTDYLLIIGGNPVNTNGSIMTAPGFARHIKELQARGGRLVVIDPRRSETARLADAHHFIRPGTDALFLLAAINTIFDEKLDKPLVSNIKTIGRVDLKRVASEFTPERVAAATGVAAETIRGIARDFAGAGSAACYSRMGICAQTFGTTATWLVDAINIITGNFDRPGGLMFPSPAVDLAALMTMLGMKGQLGRWRTRVSKLPEFNGEIPSVAMAEEIETTGERKIRALITIGGNPALVIPNSARLNAALGNLEFMVSIDPYINATTRHADYILPPSISLEHDCYPMVSYATAIRNSARYAEATVEPPPGVLPDWDILWEITQRLTARRAGTPRPIEDLAVKLGNKFKPKTILRLLLKIGPNGAPAILSKERRVNLKILNENVHGIDLGPLTPQAPKLMGKKSVNLAPALLVSDLERLRNRLAELDSSHETHKHELLFISRRQLRFMNAQLHNIEKLSNGHEQCELEMNPADAAARGISDGDRVVVTTKNGSLETGARVTENIMPGVASFPFGWNGIKPGTRMNVSDRNPGSSVNDITDETLIDAVCGMSAFNETKVKVTKV